MAALIMGFAAVASNMDLLQKQALASTHRSWQAL